MCELLAISSKKPTTVGVSLEQFANHGSDAGANMDGWGIVYYAEDDIRRFRDTGPASASDWVKFVEKQELSRLCGLWMDSDGIPDLADRYRVVAAFARQIKELGVANFIYCDGDTMFVHADRRRQANGEIRGPGLWLGQHACRGGSEKICGGGVEICSPRQKIVMAASVPLTQDGWEPLQAGSLVALKNGEVSATRGY